LQLAESGGSAIGVGTGVGVAGSVTGGCVGPAEPPPPQRPNARPDTTIKINPEARRLDFIIPNAPCASQSRRNKCEILAQGFASGS